MPQFPCLLIAGLYLQGVLGRFTKSILAKHLDKCLESNNYLANTAYYYCHIFIQIEIPVYTQPHVVSVAEQKRMSYPHIQSQFRVIGS